MVPHAAATPVSQSFQVEAAAFTITSNPTSCASVALQEKSAVFTFTVDAARFLHQSDYLLPAANCPLSPNVPFQARLRSLRTRTLGDHYAHHHDRRAGKVRS